MLTLPEHTHGTGKKRGRSVHAQDIKGQQLHKVGRQEEKQTGQADGQGFFKTVCFPLMQTSAATWTTDGMTGRRLDICHQQITTAAEQGRAWMWMFAVQDNPLILHFLFVLSKKRL